MSEGDPYKRTRLFKNKESFLCYSCNLIKSRHQFWRSFTVQMRVKLIQKGCKSLNAPKRTLRMVNFSTLTGATSRTPISPNGNTSALHQKAIGTLSILQHNFCVLKASVVVSDASHVVLLLSLLLLLLLALALRLQLLSGLTRNLHSRS